MTFPTNPVVGDTFYSDDTVWKFNGSKWDRSVIGSSNTTSYATNPITTALLNRISTLEALLDKVLIIE
jgi:hypothetical protein